MRNETFPKNDRIVDRDVRAFTVTGDRTLVAHFSNAPIGAIDALYTVGPNNSDKVYFSQGNLQYQTSTNTWRFANNQYDYVGSANSNISSSNSGWIDLFGWATSASPCASFAPPSNYSMCPPINGHIRKDGWFEGYDEGEANALKKMEQKLKRFGLDEKVIAEIVKKEE